MSGDECRCGGYGWYAEHEADCGGDCLPDGCCFYLEAYCPCEAGDRLRKCDGAPKREAKP